MKLRSPKRTDNKQRTPLHYLPIRPPSPMQRATGKLPSRAPEEEVLQIQEIQGNILAGFNKDFQALLFLDIVEPAHAKVWLRNLIPHISTMEEVLAYNRLYKALWARQGREPVGVTSTWMNIAFSYRGLTKLVPDGPNSPEQFDDNAFRTGLVNNSAALGDPTDPKDAGHPRNWVVGGRDQQGNDTVPDMLLIFAGDIPEQLQVVVNQLKESVNPTSESGVTCVFEQAGRSRADAPGHEHFGFKDGISQPGIRGRLSMAAEDFLTPRLIDPQKNAEQARRFSRPGQPLIFPGQFVFGYGRQQNTDPLQSITKQDAPDWAENGSFLVFRRLRQDVKAFHDFTKVQAAQLATQPDLSSMTPQLLEAKMVGRWPSGAPLMRSPDADIPELGANAIANNNFCYVPENVNAIALLPEMSQDQFPIQDKNYELGTICPFAAHVQKMNPRDNDTDTGGENDTLTRRILRRGIAYGVSYDTSAQPGSPGAADADRGLLFLSYQTSITNQFQFLCHDWANQVNKPIVGKQSGHDPVIGQSPASPSATRDRLFLLQRTDEVPASLTLPSLTTRWIIPTGGGYFFSPSIHAMEKVICS